MTRDPVLSFHGAARAVTGSCFRLETAAGAVLVDCGMFQGSKTEKALNYRPFPFDPATLRAVILTHAHIDHSGLLPRLVRDGFKGAIHASAGTADLCGVMLPDSAHIQESEVEMLNRRNRRKGGEDVSPIYDARDAARTLDLLRPEGMEDWFTVLPGVRARLWNAGHLLGSASVEVELSGENTPLRLLFSGDIGPDAKLLQPDPIAPSGFDYVICESTYGDVDRIEASAGHRRATLRDEVKAAWRDDGVLMIPTFAVERAQELIADLTTLMMAGDIPFCPVHVDSPMATRATAIFRSHARELENGAALVDGLKSHHLHFTETVEQSRALAHARGFHIILAASGMCEAGRIRHHLKNWLSLEAATLLLVGYQAEATLGRLLQDGARQVRIQGEEFPVRARIRSIDLYSGHADGPELVAWIRDRLPIRHALFLVHGEEEAQAGLAARLEGVVPSDARVIPALDDSFRLTADGYVKQAGSAPPRLAPEQVARLDWHNDVSRLMLDMNEALRATPDERTRNALIRRLRRALDGDDPHPPQRHPARHRH
ncbi:MBL fold metallo-hydrolase [Rhodobacteraceae bacterium HSP-20]|uniref:MBL fold metallo-hydrolase n=1 Tax=Paragemmobacter amnigenus TaxID=2852097 RepID=A0ABS6J4W7_9RHOB|nr:MBL fold metallo-hydrolase [Rhodobacter amnigenus]MBU9698542.1 MBL fold metallo-hydrolase [Rhodobacter amnigenus]MBV4389769.1 MBL fold metallo-hydrolase [Rhodobacter amnigenus]